MAGHNMGSRSILSPPPPKVPIPKPKKTDEDICREAMYKVGLIQDKKDPRVDGFVVVYKFLKEKRNENSISSER